MDRKQVDFGREKEVFPLVLIQVKSAAKRTVFDLKNKREKTFLPFKTQLFHIQVVRYAAPKSRQEHRPRLDGKIRSTAERKIFPAHPCGGLPALAKAGTVGYFCSKIVPQEVARLNGAETPE